MGINNASYQDRNKYLLQCPVCCEIYKFESTPFVNLILLVYKVSQTKKIDCLEKLTDCMTLYVFVTKC